MPRAVFLRLIRAVQTVRDPVTAELQGNTLGLQTVGAGCTGTLSYWEEENFLPSARRVLLDRQEHSATPELVSLQVSLRCCKDEVFVV